MCANPIPLPHLLPPSSWITGRQPHRPLYPPRSIAIRAGGDPVGQPGRGLGAGVEGGGDLRPGVSRLGDFAVHIGALSTVLSSTPHCNLELISAGAEASCCGVAMSYLGVTESVFVGFARQVLAPLLLNRARRHPHPHPCNSVSTVLTPAFTSARRHLGFIFPVM